jgi:hypothetical protein
MTFKTNRTETRVYFPHVVERIRKMAGKVPAKVIAAELNLSLYGLKSWGRRNGVTFKLPVRGTSVSQYDALRQRAHQLSLRLSKLRRHLGNPIRLSSKGGTISVWVSVAEGLTLDEAARFLSNRSRRHRFSKVEQAWIDAGGPSMMPKSKQVIVTKRRAA